MGCCNKQRAALRAPGATVVPATPAPRPVGPDGRLRYIGSERVRIEGAVSGRVYRASPADRLVTADPRDLRSLLRTRLFAACP